MKDRHATGLLIGATVAAALGCASIALRTWSTPSPQQLALFVVFLTLAGLAELYATRIPVLRMELSSSIAIYLASLFVFGLPLAVTLVLMSGAVSEIFLRRKLRVVGLWSYVAPVAFNVSQLVLTTCVAGEILHVAGYASLPLDCPGQFGWAVAAFSVYVMVNHGLVTGAVALSSGARFFSSLWRSISHFAVQYMVLCAAALLLTVLHGISVWHVFLGLLPLSLVHVSFRGWVRLQTEARKTFERISRLLDERDHATAVHSDEVAELAGHLGSQLGLSQTQLERLDIAARVHDIGKMAIPDSILLKPGPLTPEEWERMKTHPVVSAELIEGLEIYAPVADAVRHEHEKWDGTGYPDGLRGEEIPLLSRVISAADIYCALTADRPYRKAFTRSDACRMVEEMRGCELDPRVVDALLQLLDAGHGAATSSPIAVPNAAE